MPDAEAISELSFDQALGLALRLHRAGGLDDAEKLYGRLLDIDPDHADVLHFKGVLEHQRGRSARALELIRRSLVRHAAVPDWHNNLGNVLLETGQVEQAARCYEHAATLAPERADFRNNLGVLLREQGRFGEAEAAYRQAIALDPAFVDPHINLSRLFHAQDRLEEALASSCQALVLDPRHARARRALGMSYLVLGRRDEALRVYREWLAEEPDNPEAPHYIAACSGEGVPDRASDAYVEKVFDGFANSFDAKLALLDYRAPALVAEAVAAAIGAPSGDLAVLDAGCGTGLCGPGLVGYARRLEGVDLSEQMLAKARARGVYHRLVKAELTAFIEAAEPGSYDLVVSADTLCYFGELGPVARAAARALRPGGWLVFTVEACLEPTPAGHRIQPHGRYSHHAGYLREVLDAAGFTVEDIRGAHLRSEFAKPVDGWVVSCRTGHAPRHEEESQ